MRLQFVEAGEIVTTHGVRGELKVDNYCDEGFFKKIKNITIGGVDVTHLPEYKRAQYIGRVFQDPMMGTAADMEIQENLALAKRRGKVRGLSWGISKKERKCSSGSNFPKEKRTENSIMYPPTFVMFSKAFMMQWSKISNEK